LTSINERGVAMDHERTGAMRIQAMQIHTNNSADRAAMPLGWLAFCAAARDQVKPLHEAGEAVEADASQTAQEARDAGNRH